MGAYGSLGTANFANALVNGFLQVQQAKKQSDRQKLLDEQTTSNVNFQRKKYEDETAYQHGRDAAGDVRQKHTDTMAFISHVGSLHDKGSLNSDAANSMVQSYIQQNDPEFFGRHAQMQTVQAPEASMNSYLQGSPLTAKVDSASAALAAYNKPIDTSGFSNIAESLGMLGTLQLKPSGRLPKHPLSDSLITTDQLANHPLGMLVTSVQRPNLNPAPVMNNRTVPAPQITGGGADSLANLFSSGMSAKDSAKSDESQYKTSLGLLSNFTQDAGVSAEDKAAAIDYFNETNADPLGMPRIPNMYARRTGLTGNALLGSNDKTLDREAKAAQNKADNELKRKQFMETKEWHAVQSTQRSFDSITRRMGVKVSQDRLDFDSKKIESMTPIQRSQLTLAYLRLADANERAAGKQIPDPFGNMQPAADDDTRAELLSSAEEYRQIASSIGQGGSSTSPALAGTVGGTPIPFDKATKTPKLKTLFHAETQSNIANLVRKSKKSGNANLDDFLKNAPSGYNRAELRKIWDYVQKWG